MRSEVHALRKRLRTYVQVALSFRPQKFAKTRCL